MEENKNSKVSIVVSIIIGILLILLAGTYLIKGPFSQAKNSANACGIGETDCKTTSENPRGENFSVKSLLGDDVQVISFDDSLIKIEEEKAVVLFYSFDDCPWCYDAWPIFHEVAKEYTDKINYYYVNVSRDERVDGNETYETLKTLFNEEKIYIPYVAFIKDGQLGWSNVATVEDHIINEDGILPIISEEQSNRLKAIYKEYFEELQDVLKRER